MTPKISTQASVNLVTICIAINHVRNSSHVYVQLYMLGVKICVIQLLCDSKLSEHRKSGLIYLLSVKFLILKTLRQL